LKEAHPEWWGSNTTPGATVMTTAFASAFAASQHVILSPTHYLVGEVTLPDQDNYLHMNGARITGTPGAGQIFYATYRGKLTDISGPGQFDGPKTAIFRNASTVETPYMGSTQYREYNIHDGIKFIVNAGVKAIKLFGAREGFITNNHFEGVSSSAGTGVDTEYSIGPELSHNFFSELEYATAFRTGTEGAKVIGGTMIGNEYGIYSYRLYGLQVIGSMLDYNDNSIQLENTGAVVIDGSYISTRTANPAILIRRHTGIAYDNNDIRIVNNPAIRCNQLGAPFSDVTTAIRLENVNYASIQGNSIQAWRTNGIEYDDTTFLTISENVLIPEDTYGTYSISEDSGAVTGGEIRVRNNVVTLPIDVASAERYVIGNSGFESGVDRNTPEPLDHSPEDGTYLVGKRYYDPTPVVGQPKGWICTVAGGSYSTTRADATPYAAGVWALWTTGTTVWEVTDDGTSDGSAPSIVGKVVGDTVVDGTVTWTMRSLTATTWTSEGNW
jgi:hypothetical protein